ncbi:glycosyltransferase family 4 protein [Halobium palmae]|uniref:Glycosyltransferase family 4 protein n=1 Tax=Halobium palmae TaxID=1776492 RepID=A0ABD5RUE1_9EURY
MRIVFVSNVVYPFVTGGAEKRIYEIATRLASSGHEITIYGRHFWDGPEEMEYDGMTLRAVSPEREIYDGERRSISEALEFSKDLVVPLRRHIDEHDIVVASVFPFFPVLSSKLATVLTDTPLITTWHEVWRSYWDGYLGTLAPFGKAIEHITARTPQYPIAVSGITADRLAEIGPPRENIAVVPNGIDAAQIQRVSPATDGFDILFAGRLISDKNVDILLEAFDRVASRFDATLGIIGDGPESETLRAKATNLTHSDRVTFLGFLDEYEDVLAHMHAADIFASPSTREGFGITYAEAMAADCTVIAADHPESAASEVIGEGGYLASPTVEGVADALERALNGERPAQAPTERAKKFDWDNVAKRAETVYQRTL